MDSYELDSILLIGVYTTTFLNSLSFGLSRGDWVYISTAPLLSVWYFEYYRGIRADVRTDTALNMKNARAYRNSVTQEYVSMKRKKSRTCAFSDRSLFLHNKISYCAWNPCHVTILTQWHRESQNTHAHIQGHIYTLYL